jgi:predicted PurR-regulated permease PerM
MFPTRSSSSTCRFSRFSGYDTSVFGVDARAARAAWSVFLVALLLLLIYDIRKVLVVFVLAILFAYLLHPVVNLIERVIARPRSRPYALALVYLVLVAVIVGAGVFIGNQVAAEATTLARRFPDLLDNFKKGLERPGAPWLEPIKGYILSQLNQHATDFGRIVLPVVERVSSHVVEVLSSAVIIILIPVLSFFFLKDGRELMEQVLSLAGRRRPLWEDIASDLHTLLGQFIRALVVLSLAALVIYSVFFALIGLPYAVLLAVFAALLEFIPVVGPITAAALILAAAAFSGANMIVVLVFLVVYRMFQDYGLSPHLMGAGVELHPLLVIFGALAGEQVAGIPGMFLSVPVLATLRVVFVRIRKTRVLTEPTYLSKVEEIQPPKAGITE